MDAAALPTSSPPPRWKRALGHRGVRWGALLLFVLAAGQVAGWWMPPPAPQPGSPLLRLAGHATLQEIFDALERWRIERGQGLRYPDSLDELGESGLIAPYRLRFPMSADGVRATRYDYQPGLRRGMPEELILVQERDATHKAKSPDGEWGYRFVLLLDGVIARTDRVLAASERIALEQDEALDWWRAGPDAGTRVRAAKQAQSDLLRSLALWSLLDASAETLQGLELWPWLDKRTACSTTRAALDRAKSERELIALMLELGRPRLLIDGRPLDRDARPYERLHAARLLMRHGREKEAQALFLSLVAVVDAQQPWFSMVADLRLMAEPLRRAALNEVSRWRPGGFGCSSLDIFPANEPALRRIAKWRLAMPAG